MSLSVADPQTSQTPTVPADRTAHEIIAAARTVKAQQPPRAPFRSAASLTLLSGLAMWASYYPLNFSPLAWIALVPVLMLIRLRQPTRRMSLACYLGGLAWFLPTLQWMRLGDPSMYVAWLALAAYLAVTFPVLVGLCRLARTRWSVPMVVSVPIVWVALEYVRAHLFTGFAWYLLGHSQYRWLELIQISDLVGGYGVSFVMAASAAAMASLIPIGWFSRLKLLAPGVAPIVGVWPSSRLPTFVATGLVLFTLGYGFVRREQAAFTPGPRVGLVQGNFVASLRLPEENYGRQYLTHMKLTALAVREQPDVIIWPEGMFRWPLTSAPSGLSDEELQQLAPKAPPEFWRDTSVRETLTKESQKTGAAIIYGIPCVDLQTDGSIEHGNSAVFVRPDMGISGRYDKMHLVPFGEYLPFHDTFPWLHKLTPYPADFGLHAGTSTSVFEYQNWRMLPVICFEDTVPHLVRNMVHSASTSPQGDVDVLVNLSNDGWFHGSSGLDQHLITAAFRAVECRTPMVRAVNTGISAVIDGDGAIREPDVFIDGDKGGRKTSKDPSTGRWYRQLNAAVVSTVPLDARGSLYVSYGDWFAMLCLMLSLFTALSAFLPQNVKQPI
ncbi:apolipoprotein N-acyltransferase [bacterium]|nr:apolipoprotein N-acyltransferase [bacterium]